MDEDYISIGPGDTITLSTDPDGYPAVKIQDTVFGGAPRWILSPFSGHDQAARLDALIDALTQLRDTVRNRS